MDGKDVLMNGGRGGCWMGGQRKDGKRESDRWRKRLDEGGRSVRDGEGVWEGMWAWEVLANNGVAVRI